jgi:integrase
MAGWLACTVPQPCLTGRWGEPLYPDSVSALMSKLISKYNEAVTSPTHALPHARPHGLRHLHATTLLAAEFRCTSPPHGFAMPTQP